MTVMSDVQKINQIPVVSRLLEVLCRTTGMGFSAIARVTEDQWIACATKDLISFGLKPGDELKQGRTLCHEVRLHREPIAIDDVAEDPVYSSHASPAIYGFQSYISVPIIRKNGEFFGTLCAIDPMPAKVKAGEVIETFKLFADLISFHLNSIEEKEAASGNSAEEEESPEIREEFIGILGHDLRNPLATARMSAEILLKVSDKEIITRHAGMIKSTSYRMEGMIENLLDFARSRMGNGIHLKKEADIEALDKTLQQIIREIRIISPQRVIETEIKLEEPFPCDLSRIGQLFSNLLGNADKHGTSELPIKVRAHSRAGEFRLAVTNSGERIPEELQKNLFKPYYQSPEGSSRRGLGLGLYIASEIAKAHNGIIKVSSTDQETCFSFVCNY